MELTGRTCAIRGATVYGSFKISLALKLKDELALYDRGIFTDPEFHFGVETLW